MGSTPRTHRILVGTIIDRFSFMKSQYKIISVGGSMIIPQTGFDIEFLTSFRELLLRYVKSGMRFVLVAGGGATARTYQQAAKKVRPLTSVELDWLGIYATITNAYFLQTIIGEAASNKIIFNPLRPPRSTKPIMVAAGWKPGCSTDMDAVLLAKRYKAKNLINLSNIDQVYTADPKEHREAKPITSIDWKTFRKNIVGNTWEPGKSFPFDPIASKSAHKLKLTVSIVNGNNLPQVEKALVGQPFFGTVIGPQ